MPDAIRSHLCVFRNLPEYVKMAMTQHNGCPFPNESENEKSDIFEYIIFIFSWSSLVVRFICPYEMDLF